jgi:signal peptidase I
MVSVSIFLVLLVICFTVNVLVVTIAANAVGKERRRFTRALVPVFLLTALGWILNGASLLVPKTQPAAELVISVFQLIIFFSLPFMLFKRAFELNAKQTFAPWGAYVGTQLAVVLFLVFVLRPHICDAYFFPTQSMAPTIQPADRFLVNKLAEPVRWQVIAYWHDDRFGKQTWAKRLVGLPGERIRIENGTLYVNDQLVVAPPILAGKMTMEYPTELRVSTRFHDGETVQLGNDEMFVVGDDLARSVDSRIEGPSPFSSFIGVAECIYWPPSHWSLVN